MPPRVIWLHSADVVPPNSAAMVPAVSAVEAILKHNFKDKRLLEQALTHSSHTESQSYERLEFLGDSALSICLSNNIYLNNPGLDQGQLSQLRAVNVSTEKLARVAVKHDLYKYVVRHNASALDAKVLEFTEMVKQENGVAAYGGSVKAPKVLADIVESIAAAIYIDKKFDLEQFWIAIRELLEPMITFEDLVQQPQPVTMLFEQCLKEGKHVDIHHWKNEETEDVASVYIDGELVASSISENKEIAKLNVAKLALDKISQSLPCKRKALDFSMEDEDFEIERAKQRLHEICRGRKWSKPIYKVENEEGASHERRYVYSVKVPSPIGVFYMEGDEKSRVKDAENSAASLMIRSLGENGYL